MIDCDFSFSVAQYHVDPLDDFLSIYLRNESKIDVDSKRLSSIRRNIEVPIL